MLLVVVLQSCDNRPKTNAENNTELISKAPTTIDRLEDFRSALRPDQELKIGKIYLDTVEFLFADFDYDYWLMHVRKNGNTVEFIIDKRYDFKRSEQLVVTWKVDSIWIVGNRESLYFSERLISAKQVIISPTNEIWQVEGDGYSLTVEAVDSIQFHAVKKTIRHNTQEITKITDFAKVKKC